MECRKPWAPRRCARRRPRIAAANLYQTKTVSIYLPVATIPFRTPLAPSRAAPPAIGSRTLRALLVALALSLALHVGLTFWPVTFQEAPESTPLTATLTEMPPPPKPATVAAAKPKPRPKRAAPAQVPPAETPAETAEVMAGPESVAADSPGASTSTAPALASEPEVIPGAAITAPILPPRVDLVYNVYYGTIGFFIGDAVYRFEHTDNQYRIVTIGKARGLAALILRGQGKLQSRGLITATGLQTLEFDVERGGPDRRESAVFDWEAGIVTMHENKTATLDLPTFDPMTIMWQFYFTPPTDDVVSFSVATPRRMMRYTVTREQTEKVEWAEGMVDAERWHRRSDDGKTDAYVWLAPALRYIPVKMRVVNTDRGTVEVLLSSIRVDEAKVE
jgi:uncharacterized protein DUF3108